MTMIPATNHCLFVLNRFLFLLIHKDILNKVALIMVVFKVISQCMGLNGLYFELPKVALYN